MRYAVVIEKASKGYSAYVPDVPGCVATGRTVQQTLDRLRGALGFHFEGMQEDDEAIPDPQTLVTYLDVPTPPEMTAKGSSADMPRSTDAVISIGGPPSRRKAVR